MRIRTIKPEWLDDERLALASSDARTLSIALILLADDHGNGRANPVVLGARVFPGKVPETLAKALDTLAIIDFVVLYEVDGQRYYSIRNWAKHQKVDKPGKPQVPVFKEEFRILANLPETLAKIPETLATDQDQDQDQEGTRKGSARGDGLPPARRPREPRDADPSDSAIADVIRSEISAMAALDPKTQGNRKPIGTLRAWAKRREGDPLASIRLVARGANGDTWLAERGYPLAAIAKRPDTYLTRATAPKPANPRGMAPAASHEEHAEIVRRLGNGGPSVREFF